MNAEKIIYEDCMGVVNNSAIDWEKLWNKTVLITGATGLIGMSIVKSILHYNREKNAHISIVALVRNQKIASEIFQEYLLDGDLSFVVGDVTKDLSVQEEIDYIIHGASITSSSLFVEKPVETIMTAIIGTRNILELAKEKKVKSVVYMSSMEVYGTPVNEKPLDEKNIGFLDPLAVRSSYSESKRMVENLCVSYQKEYSIPVKIIRLTQTFGPGVKRNDNRVFAEFARCALNGDNIVLQTEGLTKRMYLYTADAVSALLIVLLSGKNGEAYNAANTTSYCTIREMAELVCESFGNGKIEVVVNKNSGSNEKYNPFQEIFLDTSKIEKLGWKSTVDLKEMYERMIDAM